MYWQTNHEWMHIQARRALGDFGVPIAIITMVALDYLVPQTYTEKLQVPEGLSPSNPAERGWIISPDMTHVWVMFAAAAPALLVYILLFMETHICEWVHNVTKLKLAAIHSLIFFFTEINTLKNWSCHLTYYLYNHALKTYIILSVHSAKDN